jgi:hypothetical protein
MDGEERDYLLARAETELDLAQRSVHPGVVRAHYQLAALYLDRVYDREKEMIDDCPMAGSAGYG